MEIINKKKVLIHLLKDFSTLQTITSLAKKLNISRVGMWKIIKKLEKEKYVLLKTIGTGKTSTSLITLNWEYPLVEKSISLYLTEESLEQRRWQVNFQELEAVSHFVILYGSILHSAKQANDIDIIEVSTKEKLLRIEKAIEKVQKTQSKKIHSLSFTEKECTTELKKENKACIEAIRKGVILFGQEKFVQYMKKVTQ